MDTFYNAIKIAEKAATPSNPPSGYQLIYPKTDGKFYVLNASGVERCATPDLTGLVPYTGATGNVDIGINSMYANVYAFGQTTSFGAAPEGAIFTSDTFGLALKGKNTPYAFTIFDHLGNGIFLGSKDYQHFGGTLSIESGKRFVLTGYGSNANYLDYNSAAAATRIITAGYALMVLTDSQKVGINNASPAEALDLVGNFRFSGALKPGGDTGANGMVMHSNGSVSYWAYASLLAWNKAGDAGTVNSNFIGTTDLRRLLFKTNSVDRFTISDDGNFIFNNDGLTRYMSFENAGTPTWKVASTAGQTSQFLCGGSTYPNWGLYYSGGYNNSIVGGIYNDGLKLGGSNAAIMNLKVGGIVLGAGTDLDTVASTALLEMKSTAKGFLPPRMTTTQKNAITSPAEGLVIYDTTLHKLCVRTASAWETITST